LTAAGSLTETADTLSREVEKFFQNLRAGSADGRIAKAG
jgi:methyl-accepting chemotaxis protein